MEPKVSHLKRTTGTEFYTKQTKCSQEESYKSMEHQWKYAYTLEETNGNGTTNPDIEVARMVRPGEQITMILNRRTIPFSNFRDDSECEVEGEDVKDVYTLFLEISDFKAKKIFRVPVYEIRLDQDELNEWFKDRKVWKTSNVYHMRQEEKDQHDDDVMDLFDIQPEPEEEEPPLMDITEEDLEALKSDAMFHGTIRALEDLKALEASKQNKIVQKL